MGNRLWTIHFIRICIANFLLFISLYMLFPVVPAEMADRLGAPVSQTGAMFLLLTLGMFAIGPFHAYLVDAYKRKYVCAFSFAVMIAATAGYGFVNDITQLLLLCLVQGIAFGMATTAGITLAIDITGTHLRSSGNVAFAWAARIGMLVGIALGVVIYQWYDFHILLYVSVICGFVGVFFVFRVYVPIRAPIVTRLCSSDRFLLPRGWLPALNFALIAFIPGLLLPVFHHSLSDVSIGKITIPFFAIVGVGFLFSVLLAKLVYREEKSLRIIILGISLMMVSFTLLEELPTSVVAMLLGLGLGLVTPEFLLIFVKLSHHCQRGTANTTYLLAWETGMSLGVAVACYMSVESSVESIYHLGRIVSPIALLFFVLLAYPYFKRKRVRPLPNPLRGRGG